MRYDYQDYVTSSIVSRAFGIESDVVDSVVSFVKEPGFMAVAATAKSRTAELTVYDDGKSVLRETNANIGVQLCTTWVWSTQQITRTSQKFDMNRGAVGEAAPVSMSDGQMQSARDRFRRIAVMVEHVLGS
jgi:hypothetical protein